MSNKVKHYFQDYLRWFPEEWKWSLADDENNQELYMKFRARKSRGSTNNDLHPYFDSIEKDANQFGLEQVTFTDIFGIRWKGKKGLNRYVGDSDYDQHMYYWPEKDDVEYIDERIAAVSDSVTASEVPEGYAEIDQRGIKQYFLMEDMVDVKYMFFLENHLFKDSYVILFYKDSIKNVVWNIPGIAFALKRFNPNLYSKFLKQVDRHFKGLQKSDNEEEREFAPTDKNGNFLKAREYFEKIEEEQAHI